MVRLTLHVRRFRCQNQDCQRKTFAERLPEVVPVSAQRTCRLTSTLTLFAFALSGQAGARLLAQIGMTTSADTLLRVAKQAVLPLHSVPTVIGVDDFALRRGKTYGTIIVDLDTHRPIELLLERTAETLSHWLVEHPGVEFISRDRSSEYMRGATQGAPDAEQVLDRWHVLNNVREVVQRVVGRIHSALKRRQKDSGTLIRPRYRKPRSSSELAASQVARLQRQRWYEEVVEHYKQGKGITAIAQELHMSPTTVRKFVYAGAFPERSVHKRRQNYRLASYLPYLQQRVQEGCENASLLWQEIHQQGFPHGYKVVNTWLREYLGKPGRHSSEQEKAKKQSFFTAVEVESGRIPSPEVTFPPTEQTDILVEPLSSPRHLTWLLVRDPKTLNQQEHQTLAFIRQEPTVDITYQLAQQFFSMVRERHADQLDGWLEQCLKSGIPDLQTFAEGLKRDDAAMKAALTFPYSNALVEGHVHRLKYIKRSMYGRGSFELLRQRVLNAV